MNILMVINNNIRYIYTHAGGSRGGVHLKVCASILTIPIL